MTIGLVLSIVLLLGILSAAIAWTIKLANTLPAVQDIMPISPEEQFLQRRKRHGFMAAICVTIRSLFK